jgi:hypothetical protein
LPFLTAAQLAHGEGETGEGESLEGTTEMGEGMFMQAAM